MAAVILGFLQWHVINIYIYVLTDALLGVRYNHMFEAMIEVFEAPLVLETQLNQETA